MLIEAVTISEVVLGVFINPELDPAASSEGMVGQEAEVVLRTLREKLEMDQAQLCLAL